MLDRSGQPWASMPTAWADLFEALFMLVEHQSDDVSPFNCSHDTLGVLSDASKFSEAELARLEELGFNVDGESSGFYSHRFGSA